MLALSPSLFSTFGWPSDDPISQEQNYNSREAETSESFLRFPSSHPPSRLAESTLSDAIGSDAMMAKKLNHNACERNRRKKINTLYSSLRSLLPVADQMKKLSMPATVSRVEKYIPELQQEVERLTQKKEELLSRISSQGDLADLDKPTKGAVQNTASAVSASWLGDKEVVIQISTLKAQTCPLSELLLNLEEDGLLLINTSSFESCGGRTFYNIHLQAEASERMECEVLSEKLLSLYENWKEPLP